MIQYLFMGNEQTHPLHETDKNIIDSLITKKTPEDLDYINLARLINRYTNFPGEIEIKNDIEKILNFWKITKNELFSKTKIIWSKSFRPSNTNKDLVGSGLIPQIEFYLPNFSSTNKCFLIHQTLKS